MYPELSSSPTERYDPARGRTGGVYLNIAREGVRGYDGPSHGVRGYDGASHGVRGYDRVPRWRWRHRVLYGMAEHVKGHS